MWNILRCKDSSNWTITRQWPLVRLALTLLLLGLLFGRNFMPSAGLSNGASFFGNLAQWRDIMTSADYSEKPIFGPIEYSPEDANSFNVRMMVIFGVVSVVLTSVLML